VKGGRHRDPQCLGHQGHTATAARIESLTYPSATYVVRCGASEQGHRIATWSRLLLREAVAGIRGVPPDSPCPCEAGQSYFCEEFVSPEPSDSLSRCFVSSTLRSGSKHLASRSTGRGASCSYAAMGAQENFDFVLRVDSAHRGY
jgi:hypothetical protein